MAFNYSKKLVKLTETQKQELKHIAVWGYSKNDRALQQLMAKDLVWSKSDPYTVLGYCYKLTDRGKAALADLEAF